MTLIKVFIIIFMLVILFSLFRGLYFLGKGGEHSSKKLLHSLKWRIGLSLALFVAIILLHYFGVIDLRNSLIPVSSSQ